MGSLKKILLPGAIRSHYINPSCMLFLSLHQIKFIFLPFYARDARAHTWKFQRGKRDSLLEKLNDSTRKIES